MVTQISEHPTLAFSGPHSTEAAQGVVRPDEMLFVDRRMACTPQAGAASTIHTFGPLVHTRDHEAADATPSSIALNSNRLARSELSGGTYSRLFAIATRPDGWRGRGSRTLTSASLSVFLEFWSVVSNDAVEPQFTLMPNGHLRAEWFKSERRHLDLEFADDWMVYCGLFNGKGVWEGKETIKNLASMLEATDSKPLRWTS